MAVITFRFKKSGGGFTARAVGYSIFTEADTLAALRVKIRDAVKCHFDRARKFRLLSPARV